MTHRRFDIAASPAREVSFELAGENFFCLPRLRADAVLDYQAGLTPDPDDPTKVAISLPTAMGFIEATLATDEDRTKFRAVVGQLPFDTGSESVHAVREYLLEAYGAISPTVASRDSSPGRSLNGDSSTADSGSMASIQEPSHSTAT